MNIPVKYDSDVIFNKSSLLKHFACINYIQISREFHFHRNYIYIYIYISSTLLNTKAVFELYTYLYLLDINANLYSFCIQIPVTL